jgi:o-succinylbenzoate---CoA ligase
VRQYDPIELNVMDRHLLPSNQRSSVGEWIYELFCQRLRDGWLVDRDRGVVIDTLEQRLHQRVIQHLTKFTQSQPNHISIATRDPIEFVATLMAGWRLGIPIFLGNPRWGTAEWEQVSSLTARVDPQQHRDLVMIPTGGSAGEIKFAIHTWETLSASVWGFQEFYGVGEISSVCTLPLYHVSGLMQLVRSLLTDGKLLIVDFHQLCIDRNVLLSQLDLDRYFISLVPTQLSKLLDLDTPWLAQFQTILLGGAPPSLELLNRARIAGLPLALTYGMTETASQVTSLKPAEFLDGNNSCGRVLPHAEIQLISSADNSTKQRLHQRVKSIRIKSKSLMLGYFPNLDSITYFDPDDLGSLDLHGYLTILGRNSSKIITGGENVFPIEVVNVIMATGLVADVWVVGLPDLYWGQVVTAIYVEKNVPVSDAILSTAIAGKISNYKIPKHWFSVTNIPRNSLGKVLISEVESLLNTFLII